ncbi:MAG: hypothetical protein MJ094_07970 [Saccharofermentans sp.]|nr:hypothetical protein [Saccharofermentans sp.]
MQKAQDNNLKTSFVDTIKAIFGSVVRTTVSVFVNIPSRSKNYFNRIIAEYKRKPKRNSANKVYVLIGYTTKQHIDSKHNAERNMIILRRGLLALIFILIFFILLNRITPYININQYFDMFGITSVDDVTRNDPFVATTEVSNATLVVEQ